MRKLTRSLPLIGCLCVTGAQASDATPSLGSELFGGCPSFLASTSNLTSYLQGVVFDTGGSTSRKQVQDACERLDGLVGGWLRDLPADHDLELYIVATLEGAQAYRIATFERISHRDAPHPDPGAYGTAQSVLEPNRIAWEQYSSWVRACLFARCLAAPTSHADVFELTLATLKTLGQHCPEGSERCASVQLAQVAAHEAATSKLGCQPDGVITMSNCVRTP